MADADLLLKAILANPEEDTPRLMYADAIQDEEPDRAEFIRVQVELERTPVTHPRGTPVYRHAGGDEITGFLVNETPNCYRLQLQDRERELWLKNHKAWEVSCPGSYMGADSNATWARGFLSEMSLPCKAFMAHAGRIFSEQPVVKVTLADKFSISGDFPHLHRGRYLQWYDNYQAIHGEPAYGLPRPIIDALIILGGWAHLDCQSGSVNDKGLLRTQRPTEGTHTINVVYEQCPVESGYLSRACLAYGREQAAKLKTACQ